MLNPSVEDASYARRRTILILAVLLLGTGALFRPVRNFEFLNFDDPSYVTANPPVLHGLTLKSFGWAFTSFYSSNWHPLTWLSHMLDCQLFGEHAGFHHIVNVLLHALSAGLLFLLLNRVTRAPWRSAIVAALFAWHPLHIESVSVAGVTIATLALLGSVGGYWTWIWMAPPLEPNIQTQVEPASQVASAVGLFGNMQGEEKLTAPTGIAIRLLGIVAASEGRDAYAVVVLDGKQIVATREGGDITAGIRLAEVAADHVILDRSGVRESLAWPEKNLAGDNPAQRVHR